MEEDCPVCAAKTRAAALLRLCNLGRKTHYDVAKELGCSYEQVMKHVNESHDLCEDESGKLQTQDVLLKRLAGTLNTLQEWTDFIIVTVTKPEDVDRNKVQMLTQLTKEIRGTIGDIAELQGRKGPGDTYMQIQVLNARIVNFTHAIEELCCDECKMKIISYNDNQPRLMEGTNVSQVQQPRVQVKTR